MDFAGSVTPYTGSTPGHSAFASACLRACRDMRKRVRVGLVGNGQTQKLGSFWKHRRKNTKGPGGRQEWGGWAAGRARTKSKETKRPGFL